MVYSGDSRIMLGGKRNQGRQQQCSKRLHTAKTTLAIKKISDKHAKGKQSADITRGGLKTEGKRNREENGMKLTMFWQPPRN